MMQDIELLAVSMKELRTLQIATPLHNQAALLRLRMVW
jgi:hypothetical protein